MNQISKIFSLYKTYGQEVQLVKIMALVTINTWLLIIFWKILLVENVNVMANNVALTKMQTWLGPVLQLIGLDMLSPSVIKLLIVTTIVIGSNLMVLNFNGMIAVIGLLGITRYGYKSYTNYLINLENMSKVPQIPMKVVEKSMEQVPVVINTGGTSGTNWMLWGALGLVVIAGVAFMIWSHNTNANGILELNNITQQINNNTYETIRQVDVKSTRVGQHMDQLVSKVDEKLNSVNTKTDLLKEKITNLETGFQGFGEKIVKLEENNLANIKLLSEESLKLTTESKGFFKEVLESNTATEALWVSIAKLYDGFTLLDERTSVTETRLDTFTEQKPPVTTPRPSGMFRTPTLNLRNNNDNL